MPMTDDWSEQTFTIETRYYGTVEVEVSIGQNNTKACATVRTGSDPRWSDPDWYESRFGSGSWTRDKRHLADLEKYARDHVSGYLGQELAKGTDK